MRVIILGSGGIGCVMGGHLARTGTEVLLVGRGQHVETINQQGLRLVTPDGPIVQKIPAVNSVSQITFRPDDVVFLTAKSQATDAAMRDLKQAVSDIPVFCFQNGVTNEETAHRYFPNVYGAMVRVGAEYLTPGEVIARRDPPGWFVIGRYPAAPPDAVAEAAAERLRRAGFLVRVVRDAIPYKWGKLVLNLGNAVDAITNASDKENRAVLNAARQEAVDMLTSARIDWVSAEQLAATWPEIAAKPRATISGGGYSSSWQSLSRQTGNIETEYFNGEIVKLARKLGKSAPVNEGLWRISEEMCRNHELPGKFSPEQLRGAVGLK